MSQGPMSLEKVDEPLQEIMGWGQYHATAYRVLVAEGPLEAQEIVVRTSIPHGRIYDVLNELHQEGVIDKQERNPAIYKTKNPGRLIEEKQNDFNEIVENTKETLVTADELNSGGEQSTPAWVLGGQVGTVGEIRDQLANVQESLLIVDSDPRWYDISDFRQLQRYAGSDIDLNIILWTARQNKIEEFSEHGLPVHKHDNMSRKSFYVVDKKKVIMKMEESDTGMIFTDRTMASVFIREFKELRDNATEVTPNA
ncbi:TrmB family transcriptional regulator [Haloterrigena salifodinae]|uniref:TrmB family transcriptional regulator n=1 Tax=Haloterrigena salifodinae TaxID=2675099 RepID=UPI000F88EA57|nr:helix-turn-helix domain-containing protein [Haloterrigena salifodinae]